MPASRTGSLLVQSVVARPRWMRCNLHAGAMPDRRQQTMTLWEILPDWNPDESPVVNGDGESRGRVAHP